jgi:hypothetical protein
MAKHFKVSLTPDIENFFQLTSSGTWEEVKEAFESLKERRSKEPFPENLNKLWSPILETYGVMETAHDWPAQELLNYGEAILGALRPGMVYLGGTDSGRFIPTLLNETSEGERHVVLTRTPSQTTHIASMQVFYMVTNCPFSPGRLRSIIPKTI